MFRAARTRDFCSHYHQLSISLGKGSWEAGFANVTAQLFNYGSGCRQLLAQSAGTLPPTVNLSKQYLRWQLLYEALYGSARLGGNSLRRYSNPAQVDDSLELVSCEGLSERSSIAGVPLFEFDMSQPTRLSQHDFDMLSVDLKSAFNSWLRQPALEAVEHCFQRQGDSHAGVEVVITATDPTVLQFPWQLWSLLETYPKAELSLSLSADVTESGVRASDVRAHSVRASRSQNDNPYFHRDKSALLSARILVILGHSQGIDTETDGQLLSLLPNAHVQILAQPSLSELCGSLQAGCWDVVYFAGHSQAQVTEAGEACFHVNDRASLSAERLAQILKPAVTSGLQLVVLNSCNSISLAWALTTDAQLPRAIAMRESISDGAAHAFLKAFSGALASGQALHPAIWEAREALKERVGSYASLLPAVVRRQEIKGRWCRDVSSC